jgi:hypothetical protein
MLGKKWAKADYHPPFLLWIGRSFLSNTMEIWRRTGVQRCFPRVAPGGIAMAEYVEVSVEAKLGREAAPPRRVDAAIASGKERVIHRGESILLVHPWATKRQSWENFGWER